MNIEDLIKKIEQRGGTETLFQKCVVRFVVKRRWGGAKKYAHTCYVYELSSVADHIARCDGDLIGVDFI
ncbi:hypothetical protein [Escherichia coli]|uniref:hypothetical protein n=1 Tax=Escherichia coli TaxID=562 RepID=UPI000E1C85A4|nr:hypothetical protein [Escherichia coli]